MASMVSLGKRYTYEELMECMDHLVCSYPNLLRLEEAGLSHDERTIMGIYLGTSSKCLICSSGVHGRESINPVLMLKMIEDYCQRWEEEPLLAKYSIYFLPLLNPDGYEIALRGFTILKNPALRQAMQMRDEPSESWKLNSRGVDINRNFHCKSYQPGHGSWRSASENETRALIYAFHKYSDSIGYMDFHSRGRIIYYYRNAMSCSYNHKSREIALAMQKFSHYQLGKENEEQETTADGGNTVNYYSEVFGKPAITVETLEDEAMFPLDPMLGVSAYLEICELPLIYLSEYRP